MQLIKYDLLQHSPDNSVKALMSIRSLKEAKFSRVWRPTLLSESVNAEVDLDLKFPSQSNRLGLGFNHFNPNPTPVERRQMITSKAHHFAEQERLSHAATLAQQGVWLQWADQALPFDFSWSNLIWGASPQIINFVLNASINWVATPHLLKLWGLKESGSCTLCSEPKCTLHHIISHCQFSLHSKRYIWRHDSILSHIKQILGDYIAQINKEPPCQTLLLSDLFVKAGQNVRAGSRKSVNQKSLLFGASDWKLLVDLDSHKIVFPTEICDTSQRPDVIIWSSTLQKVILLELTCPAEEGIVAARLRKEAKYLPLLEQIKRNKWSVTFLTMEEQYVTFVNIFVQFILLTRRTTGRTRRPSGAAGWRAPPQKRRQQINESEIGSALLAP
jgi:hypothetical protein